MGARCCSSTTCMSSLGLAGAKSARPALPLSRARTSNSRTRGGRLPSSLICWNLDFPALKWPSWILTIRFRSANRRRPVLRHRVNEITRPNVAMAIPKEVSIGSDVLKFFDRDRDYEDQRARLADIIDARLRSSHDDGKLRCDASSLRNQINESVIAATSGTLSDYFHTLAEIVAASDDLSSPLCLGNMTSVTPNFSSMLAELVVTLNQNLVKRDASHALTLLEQQVIADLHRLVYHSSDDFY